MTTKVLIQFDNGSVETKKFKYPQEASYFAQNKISYTGNTKRVEIVSFEGSVRAVWDKSWDDFSKYSGLKFC